VDEEKPFETIVVGLPSHTAEHLKESSPGKAIARLLSTLNTPSEPFARDRIEPPSNLRILHLEIPKSPTVLRPIEEKLKQEPDISLSKELSPRLRMGPDDRRCGDDMVPIEKRMCSHRSMVTDPTRSLNTQNNPLRAMFASSQ
jgi:hypothetical protein